LSSPCVCIEGQCWPAETGGLTASLWRPSTAKPRAERSRLDHGDVHLIMEVVDEFANLSVVSPVSFRQREVGICHVWCRVQVWPHTTVALPRLVGWIMNARHLASSMVLVREEG
jgi:hypothetical protein